MHYPFSNLSVFRILLCETTTFSRSECRIQTNQREHITDPCAFPVEVLNPLLVGLESTDLTAQQLLDQAQSELESAIDLNRSWLAGISS